MRTLLIAALCATIIGCATTPGSRLRQVSTAVELAAYTGTTLHLQKKPQDKIFFEAARQTMSTLIKDGQYDPVKFREALQKLPIKELKDERGAIVITSATILYESFVGELTDLDRAPAIKQIMTSARDGLSRALDPP